LDEGADDGEGSSVDVGDGSGFVVRMGLVVGVGLACFVQVLGFGEMGVGSGGLLVGCGVCACFCRCAMLKDGDFGCGNAGAIYSFYLEGDAEVEGLGCVMEDGRGDAGVKQSGEKHVTGDAGETVQIGDTHG